MEEENDTPASERFALPWDDSFLRALGYFLVQANYLEEALLDLYVIVTDKDWRAALEDVRGKTLGVLCKLVLAAYEARFPHGELRIRLDALKPDLQRAIETRNEFVHASWAFDHYNESMLRTRRPRRGVAEEFRRLTAADVERATEFVGGVAEHIWERLYDSVEVATRPTRSMRSGGGQPDT